MIDYPTSDLARFAMRRASEERARAVRAAWFRLFSSRTARRRQTRACPRTLHA